MASVIVSCGNRRVFNSVFPLSTSERQPAVASSRGAGSTSTTTLVHSSNSESTQQPQSWSNPQINSDQITWETAWRVVTHFLSLPTKRIDDELAVRLLDSNDDFNKSLDGSMKEALRVVLHPEVLVPSASPTDSLEQWYQKAILTHFKLYGLPYLSSLGHPDDAIIRESLRLLAGLRRLYESGAKAIMRSGRTIGNDRVDALMSEIVRYFQALVKSTWLPLYGEVLRMTVCGYLNAALNSATFDPEREFSFIGESQGRDTLVDMVEMLRYVGLAGERFQTMLNELLGLCMANFISLNYRETWKQNTTTSINEDFLSTQSSKSQLPNKSSDFNQLARSRYAYQLDQWVERSFARIITELLAALDLPSPVINIQAWKLIAKDTLAKLRSSELYDVVVSWPDSKQAIVDLRATITSPFQRSYLIETFRESLRERLLHPGSSTFKILRIYILMIRCFHALDSAKVLLDNVAHELQAYVCSREDTVRIIITGLLSETKDVQLGSERLVELAVLLDEGEHVNQKNVDDEFDWHDLEWVPRPVDAGPGFKRSKTADIIGTLIGVLGSQEVFIREFQNTIGETLLKQDGDFQREIKVLELLKSRFGEAPLQSCDVMIRDVQISRSTNSAIRRDQQLDVSTEEVQMAIEMQDDNPDPATTLALAEGLLKPSFNAKILSRMYWPQLHEETYQVPVQIHRLQSEYEKGFEAFKKARKLTWLHHLGEVDVELEFNDRIIDEKVHTWQATIIYAFEGNDITGKGVERTVEELVNMLSMDEALVRSALTFWVGKLVLHSSAPDTYMVIEDLSKFDTDRDSAEVAAAAAATENAEDPALLANEQDPAEELKKYWPLIQGMLTNTMSQMPLGQIGMMLGIVVEGGFPFSNEDLAEFLNGEVESGVLEMVAGKYRLKK